MDKINLANWGDIFGKTEQNLVFTSPRYAHMQMQFEEPGLASGSLEAITTPGMQLTELVLHAESPFQLIDDPKEMAESVFMLEGSAESRLENLSGTLCLDTYGHNFQYNDQFGGAHIIRSPRFHALTITYDIPFLNELSQNDGGRSIGQLANCVHRKKTFLAGRNGLRFGSRMAEVIHAIRQCRFTGTTRYLFLESKMMELFVLQIEQAQALSNQKSEDSHTAADREKLYAIREYIESAYLESFSLKELTYRFGLNEFKLKKGYKQLFQTTVFGHVHQLRMQRACHLLKEQEMNVSEVAFLIGYNNVSSFCTEFKKQFGYSPGRYKLQA